MTCRSTRASTHQEADVKRTPAPIGGIDAFQILCDGSNWLIFAGIISEA
jgi:hypothetical protein